MYCPRCGKQMHENARFCMNCGVDIQNYGVPNDNNTYSQNNDNTYYYNSTDTNSWTTYEDEDKMKREATAFAQIQSYLKSHPTRRYVRGLKIRGISSALACLIILFALGFVVFQLGTGHNFKEIFSMVGDAVLNGYYKLCGGDEFKAIVESL